MIHTLFFHQWQRKLVALLTALVIWILVSHSITSTKTIPSVPIRIINLPTDKTINGLLSNGFLSKRTALTLAGTKDVIDQLEAGDIEVIIDVAHLPNDGIVQITKKNLISLNPNLNLSKHVTFVNHPEFVIKMSPSLTEKIPIVIRPIGQAPNGYEFLDIWPMHLTQTVSGPQELVSDLKNKGLEMTFNLNDITQVALDTLHESEVYDDEISFNVPNQWKKIIIPFSSHGPETLNDPEAKNLQINFIKIQLLTVENDLPVHVFYPLKYSDTINPSTYPLATTNFIQLKNQLPILTVPVFAKGVSKLFLEIVKDNIELDIVAAPATEKEKLEWSLSFVDESNLEDAYTNFLLKHSKTDNYLQAPNHNYENFFRHRFRLYLQRLNFYLSSQYKLELESYLENGKIHVHVPNAFLLKKQKNQNAH